MIDTASSSRDEGSLGGSGAADGAIRPAKSRPRDDRHQVTQATSSPCPTSRSRSPEITEITSSSRDEGSVGRGGAVRVPHAPPKSRRRDDRHQLAPIMSSPCPPSRSRPPEITQIASSSRDEGSVGGVGAVRAPHASPKSRPRDDRHQVTQATSSPRLCPPSRSRPSEITEIASSSRDEGSVGGGGAVRAPHAPPKSRRRDDRRQLALITPSRCPPSRSRPPEITEISSSS